MSGVYEATEGIKIALDNILDKIRSSFEKIFPDAVQLNWWVICLVTCVKFSTNLGLK